MSTEKFAVRSGCLDLGGSYEVLVAAYYGLTLCLDQTITDFKLSTNNDEMGNFDDIVLELTFPPTSETLQGTHLFAIQLKHATHFENITLVSFTEKKGAYALKKYADEFKNIEGKCRAGACSYKIPFENFHFVLLTNRGVPVFEQWSQRKKVEVHELPLGKSKMKIYKHDQCPAGNLINLSVRSDRFVYKFAESAPQSGFWQNFFLYVHQRSLKEIERDLSKKLLDNFKHNGEKVLRSYLNFFKFWWRGDYGFNKLTKDIIIKKITEFVLMDSVPDCDFGKIPRTYQLLQDCIAGFDTVIFPGGAKEPAWGAILEPFFRGFYHRSLNFLHTDENQDVLPPGEIPFYINRPHQEFYSLKELYIILWHLDRVPLLLELDEKNMETNLNGIRLGRAAGGKPKRFIIFGKKVPTMGKVFQNLSDLPEPIYRKCESLTVCLQERNSVPLKQLLELDPGLKSKISSENLLEMMFSGPLLIGGGYKPRPVKHYIPRSVSKILLKPECRHEVNEAFIAPDTVPPEPPSKSYHSVREHQENLEWASTLGSIKNLQRYRIPSSQCENFKVPDQEMLHYFQNPLNLICGEPGMGKSVIMDFLWRQYPAHVWVVKIQINEHVSFFKGQPNLEQSLEHFTQVETREIDQEVVRSFRRRKALVFLWDGFDELPEICLEGVLDLVGALREEGYSQWISSRNSHRVLLEETFNVFALDILNFSEEDQRAYVTGHLRETYHDEERLNEAVDKFLKNLEKSLKCAYFDYTGVPLQVHMVLEIYLKNYEKYSEEYKILTDIYQGFLSTKIEEFFDRAQRSQPNAMTKFLKLQTEKIKLRSYKAAALKASFPGEILSSLVGIPATASDFDNKRDMFGIVCGVSDEGKPIFTHKTYEEFLTATWIVEEWDRNKTLLRGIFHKDYSNIRLMVDMISAGNNPLHIAILYEDLGVLERADPDSLLCKNKLGRSLLQVACSWGIPHPVGPLPVIPQSKLPRPDTRIINFLLEAGGDATETDEILHWNAVQFADNSLSLAAIEAMASSGHRVDFEELTNFNNTSWVLSYAVQMDYQSLFQYLPELKVVEIKTVDGIVSVLELAVQLDRFEIVKKLLKAPDYRALAYQQYQSLMATAVSRQNSEMVQLLSSFECNGFI